jgi:hypothetical protein
VAAANRTRYPDRFEIAARTWEARAEIISGCEGIIEQVETQAPPGRGVTLTLGLRHHLDDMRYADRERDDPAWYAAIADFLGECVDIRKHDGHEDRL